MCDTAFGTIPNVDVVLFLIDAKGATIDSGNEKILEKIKKANKKTILVINKIDLVKKESLLELIDLYSKEYNFEAILPISAIKGENIETIFQEIEKHLTVRTSIL